LIEINYKIIKVDYEEDILGSEGFFELKCNGNLYGEFYPDELESIMDKVSLYDWFTRMLRVVIALEDNSYVVLSDVESYNTWIEFTRMRDEVTLHIIEADKPDGSMDIEFELMNKSAEEWNGATVTYMELKCEVVEKSKQYLAELLELNNQDNENEKIIELEHMIKKMNLGN